MGGTVPLRLSEEATRDSSSVDQSDWRDVKMWTSDTLGYVFTVELY